MHLPLDAWPDLADLLPTALDDGLINHTWRLDGPRGPVGVLQALNTRIFDPVLHEDLDAVTSHLALKGVLTPRLVHTGRGELFHRTADGGVWRVLTWVGSRTIGTIGTPAEAASAGELVGRFHAALGDLAWDFRNPRRGVHDTDRHAANLRAALARHADHPLHAEVAVLADGLLARWEALRTALPALPTRVVHGDLKISNVRFDGPVAVALVDLDTLQRDTLGAELGDALRSWCGTAGEDSPVATFDLDVLEAALRGYARGAAASPPTDAEWSAIVGSIVRITNELAMRFAADALDESYFGWDKARFSRSGEHQLARARGQARLAEAVVQQRQAAEALVAAARAG